jgi:hypothetical protein
MSQYPNATMPCATAPGGFSRYSLWKTCVSGTVWSLVGVRWSDQSRLL